LSRRKRARALRALVGLGRFGLCVGFKDGCFKVTIQRARIRILLALEALAIAEKQC
jgi:hypothetical protein